MSEGLLRMLTRLEQGDFIQRKRGWKNKWITLMTKGEDKMAEVFEYQLVLQTPLQSSCPFQEQSI